jgi:pyruvate,water dikinase
LGIPVWSKTTQAKVLEVPGGEVMSALSLTTINGYAYYDYSHLQRARPSLLLRIIPAMKFLLRTAIQRWEQEAHPAYVAVVDRWQAEDVQAISATRLFDGARQIVNQAADYYLTIQSGILPVVYVSEALFTFVYDRLIRRRNDPPASTFLLGYESAPIRVEKSLYDLARWVRAQAGLTDILVHMSSSEFAAAYQARQIAGVDHDTWLGFQKRFATHMANFGHAIYDLDFAKAVPANDPASLLETFKFFLRGEALDPYIRQEETVAAREQAVATMLTRLHGIRLWLFQRLLRWAQRFAPVREDALADVGLGWPVVRCMLHEIGRRLVRAHAIDTQDDIFWLTLDEVQTATDMLDNEKPLIRYQSTIDERRATWKHQSTVTPPVKLPIKGGLRFLGIDWRRFVPAKTGQKEGQMIKGVGASVGRVSGLARVIRGPDEFSQMRPGDILVARITTPAWTPLFALAAGVVTDVGGPLSHSSIVAREYRIPAVLGTGVATERLHSGQRVTVDGDTGTVTISSTRE